MGISRSSLREACQRLVRDGLLTQIPGRGLFVTRMDAVTMSDFIDYRLGIEMQAASIVADRVAGLRADGDDQAVVTLLAPLRECLERTRLALEAEEVIEAGNADLELHQQIAEIGAEPLPGLVDEHDRDPHPDGQLLGSARLRRARRHHRSA